MAQPDRFDLLAEMIGTLRPEEVSAGAQRVVGVLVTGARARILLVDYGQTCLVELEGDASGHRESFGLDATVAGRSYTTGHPQEVSDEAGFRLWLPLLEGSHRIGVLEIHAPREVGVDQRTNLEAVAAVLAGVLFSRSLLNDSLQLTRRLLPMELAAEIVWSLLPPLTFVNEDVSVAGILEPCYDVGGDTFDYAVNGRVAHVALFDAVGHGIAASTLSSLSVAAYRNARRSGLDLIDTARSIDAVLRAQAQQSHFVTAILGELNLDTGRYRRISAGHPGELLVRGGKMIKQLAVPSWTPLGLGYLALREPETLVEDLEPGDHLLLYSDGVTEARTAAGELFGEQRLADYVVKALADALPAAETMRRLVQAVLFYQNDELQDDATAVLLGWRASHVQP